MKSEKGITLISLILYVILLVIVVSMLNLISNMFFTNIDYVTENSKEFSSDENKIIEYIRACKTKQVEATKFILDLAKDMRDEYNKRK